MTHVYAQYIPSLYSSIDSAHRYTSCFVMNESRKYVNIHEMPITVYVPINAWANSSAMPIP